MNDLTGPKLTYLIHIQLLQHYRKQTYEVASYTKSNCGTNAKQPHVFIAEENKTRQSWRYKISYAIL